MNRIPEGGKAVVNCLASGSLPVITNWYRGGELLLEKQRGNMLEITDATMYDTGRYVCTVKNPAGEATAETYVQIRKYGHPGELPFKKRWEGGGCSSYVLGVIKQFWHLLGWCQSINQSINFNLNSHKHYFYSVEKEK